MAKGKFLVTEELGWLTFGSMIFPANGSVQETTFALCVGDKSRQDIGLTLKEHKV